MKLEIVNKNMTMQGEITDDTDSPVIYLDATIELKSKNSQVQWNIANHTEYTRQKETYFAKIKEFQDLVDLEREKILTI